MPSCYLRLANALFQMCFQALPVGVDLCTELLHFLVVRLGLLEEGTHRKYVPGGYVNGLISAKFPDATLTGFQCSHSRRLTEALLLAGVWEALHSARAMDRVVLPFLRNKFSARCECLEHEASRVVYWCGDVCGEVRACNKMGSRRRQKHRRPRNLVNGYDDNTRSLRDGVAKDTMVVYMSQEPECLHAAE
jgi:hypothetical protein